MNLLAQDYPDIFLNNKHQPCISLYQPTHRAYPDKEQDIIRFKNLVKEIEQSLEKKYANKAVKTITKPFYDLLDDHLFWSYTHGGGLAVLANPEIFRIYRLPRQVPEISVVADNFHIKPLIRIMQSAGRFQILGLTRSHIKLYEGNRDEMAEVVLHEKVPNTLTKALGDELTNPRLTVSSYGKGATGPAMYHGHGGRKDDIALDTERFFRVVDEAITHHHSRISKLPLVLATLPEYHHLFHKISQNPYLLKDDIKSNPDELSLDELRMRAWSVIEPHYLSKLETVIQRFCEVRTNDHGSDDLNDVAKAAVTGRVETLLIDADRTIPGQIDPVSGECRISPIHNPQVDDVLDDLGEMVLKTGGDVIIVPSNQMPTENGLAAIYRY